MLLQMLQIVERVAVAFVNSLTPPPPVKTTPLQNLFAQPHRVFFFFGVLFSVILVLLLGADFLGLVQLHVPLSLYHAYAFMYIVFTQFFAGFLLTTFPRYLSMPAVLREKYIPVAYITNGAALLFVISLFFDKTFILLPMFGLALGYLQLFMVFYRMFRASKVNNKQDTAWILIAFFFGFLGQILFMLSNFLPTLALATEIGFYLYLFFLVLVVAQKMIPFFTTNVIKDYKINKSKYFLQLVFTLLLIKVVFVFFALNQLLVHIALFGVLSFELFRWRLPFFRAPAILWVLYLALWWMPVGFALFTLDDIFALLQIPVSLQKAPLHALSLGYFTTLLLGFGTRIILGHSNRIPKADSYTVVLFIFIQIMTVVRIFAGIFPEYGYLHAILTSVLLWILIFAFWSKKYLFILFEK